MTTTTFVPEYSPWRHGGWYVDNVRWPNGGVGCVSRNYPDGKWRIVCDPRRNPPTFASRDDAAQAELELTRMVAMLAALRQVRSGINSDQLRFSENANLPQRAALGDAINAAIALAESAGIKAEG